MNGCVSVCDVNLLKWVWFLCCFYQGWTWMLMLSDNQSPACGWIRLVYVCVSIYLCVCVCIHVREMWLRHQVWHVNCSLMHPCLLNSHITDLKKQHRVLYLTRGWYSILSVQTVSLIKLFEYYILATSFQMVSLGEYWALPATWGDLMHLGPLSLSALNSEINDKRELIFNGMPS